MKLPGLFQEAFILLLLKGEWGSQQRDYCTHMCGEGTVEGLV